jgi:hypothetical protein
MSFESGARRGLDGGLQPAWIFRSANIGSAHALRGLNRVLKNAQNRLLARAARNRRFVFVITYRAATARERLSSGPV